MCIFVKRNIFKKKKKKLVEILQECKIPLLQARKGLSFIRSSEWLLDSRFGGGSLFSAEIEVVAVFLCYLYVLPLPAPQHRQGLVGIYHKTEGLHFAQSFVVSGSSPRAYPVFRREQVGSSCDLDSTSG